MLPRPFSLGRTFFIRIGGAFHPWGCVMKREIRQRADA
jgi:hypothetical protein